MRIKLTRGKTKTKNKKFLVGSFAIVGFIIFVLKEDILNGWKKVLGMELAEKPKQMNTITSSSHLPGQSQELGALETPPVE